MFHVTPRTSIQVPTTYSIARLDLTDILLAKDENTYSGASGAYERNQFNCTAGSTRLGVSFLVSLIPFRVLTEPLNQPHATHRTASLHVTYDLTYQMPGHFYHQSDLDLVFCLFKRRCRSFFHHTQHSIDMIHQPTDDPSGKIHPLRSISTLLDHPHPRPRLS